MKLLTITTKPGNWIKVNVALSNPNSDHYLTVGDKRLDAFIDGKNVQVRCPALEPGDYPVALDDILVGTITVINT